MERNRFTEYTPPPTTGLQPYTGSFGAPELRHLLRRTLFGATKADMAHFSGKSVTQVVNELLNPTAPLPAPPVKEYVVSATTLVPDNNIAAGTTWVGDINNDGNIAGYRRASFKKWWVGNLINQDRSIREKMTLFWHNHFATETNDISNAQYVYKHHHLMRTSALGNFKTLTKNMTLDPGMLVYLNGQYNTLTAPDENYAREIQELFCCGKGPDSLYTEEDVKAAAKVLTGWRNNATTMSAYFTASRHDATNKTFSSFYNNTVITGRNTAAAGDQELDDLLNMIFANQEVAKYMCRRLYRWFVYYDIDDTVEQNVITPLANVFRLSNYEILPVLDMLLKSEHFFDVLSRGCVIKSPAELVIGFCRESEIVFQPDTDYIANYGFYNYMVSWLSNMQQNIGDPPDVSGWKAYYQEPQFNEIWINSDTLPKRNQFTDTMLVSGYTFSSKKIQLDPLAYAKTFSNPGDPNVFIAELTERLLGLDISAASKAQLKKDILLSGQSLDIYWTQAWDLYISTPTNAANTTSVRTKIRDLVKYLMNLAEYQLA
jgi:uncharacterized protein (DUF1800 family)